MTVQEHMMFYSQAKGIHHENRNQEIDDILSKLGLDVLRSKLAGALSGGNKRKLSVAIAVIGRPPLILLDEPSAGMDPEARRLMW
jgi:ABC-type multidrug transport system ATPase subunit